MPITLVREASDIHLSRETDDNFWPFSFKRVLVGPIDPVLHEFDVVIGADQLREPPRVGPGARVAFHCTHLEALAHLVSFGSGAEILFQPTFLARLDRHRALRMTLILARALDAGHKVTARDLVTEIGGLGMAATLKATAIGRPLLYDLPSGSAIDFGMIGERGEELA
jgi:hypothetical protein